MGQKTDKKRKDVVIYLCLWCDRTLFGVDATEFLTAKYFFFCLFFYIAATVKIPHVYKGSLLLLIRRLVSVPIVPFDHCP